MEGGGHWNLFNGLWELGISLLSLRLVGWWWDIISSRRLATLSAQCRHRIYNLTELGLTHKHKQK